MVRSRPADTPKPLYVLVGNDSFLQQEELRALLATLAEDVHRVDVDGASADAADVFDEVRTVSMFGSSRVIVVRDADAFVTRHREAVEDFIGELKSAGSANGLSANVLVLRMTSLPKNQRVYKLATASGDVRDCEAPKARDLDRWVVDRARRHDLKLSADAAAALVDLLGSDLGLIDNELAKLAVMGTGTVDPATLQANVAFRREQQMWTLTDSLGGQNPARAVQTWRRLVDSDPSAEFRAVTWLAIWLDKIVKARRLAAAGRRVPDIARELRIWPAHNAESIVRLANRLGETRLRRLTDRLAKLDYGVKVGVTDPRRGVEAFLLAATPDA